MISILGLLALASALVLLFLAVVEPGGVNRWLFAFYGFMAVVSVVKAVSVPEVGDRLVWVLSAVCVGSAMALEWRAMPTRPNSTLPERENQR